jgi:hypothetical protein
MLKDKLTEEEYDNLDRLIVARYVEGLSYPQRLLEAKQSGIIRKSPLVEAREKTNEYISEIRELLIYRKNMSACACVTKTELEQLIQAERRVADNHNDEAK